MNMHFKNTMIRGEHRLYSWNGNNRQKLRGIGLQKGEFGGLVLRALADSNNSCTIDLPQEEIIDICKALLCAAGIKAVVVENPRLVTVEVTDEDFQAFSNVPGMKCTHYRFDSMSPESERLEEDYADDVEPLKNMEVEVRDQLDYADEDRSEEEEEEN